MWPQEWQRGAGRSYDVCGWFSSCVSYLYTDQLSLSALLPLALSSPASTYLILFKSKLNVFRVAAVARASVVDSRRVQQPDLDILGKRKAGREGGRVDLHSSLVEPILRRFSHGVVSETSQISARSTMGKQNTRSSRPSRRRIRTPTTEEYGGGSGREREYLRIMERRTHLSERKPNFSFMNSALFTPTTAFRFYLCKRIMVHWRCQHWRQRRRGGRGRGEVAARQSSQIPRTKRTRQRFPQEVCCG